MNLLLEKLPEFFDINPETQKSQSLEDDVGRLIINQFRWLDFLVDPKSFTDKLMEILIICPLHLKKEIIGSLPEIIGDQTNNKSVIDSLQEMLKEDSAVIVPVLDSFSNLNLDDELQEQVITIALSCIRSIDAEHMPYLLRFLLLSAKQSNVRRIISHVRQHLKFVGVSSSRALQQNKLKGKSVMDNSEVSILDALRSSLRFKNVSLMSVYLFMFLECRPPVNVACVLLLCYIDALSGDFKRTEQPQETSGSQSYRHMASCAHVYEWRPHAKEHFKNFQEENY